MFMRSSRTRRQHVNTKCADLFWKTLPGGRKTAWRGRIGRKRPSSPAHRQSRPCTARRRVPTLLLAAKSGAETSDRCYVAHERSKDAAHCVSLFCAIIGSCALVSFETRLLAGGVACQPNTHLSLCGHSMQQQSPAANTLFSPTLVDRDRTTLIVSSTHNPPSCPLWLVLKE